MTGWTHRIYEWMKNRHILKRFLQKDRDKMKRLYPGISWEEQLEKYHVETISLLMKIGFFGITITGAVFLYHFSVKQDNVSSVERSDYGEGTKYLDVVGYGQEGMQFESSLEIREREYTNQELQSLYETLLPVLESGMVGENESLLQVQKNLVFPEEVSGFPFQISWKSSDSGVINKKGELSEEYRDKEENVMITAKIEYNDFLEEYSWEVKVVPCTWTSEQLWQFNVEKALQESDEQSITEGQWILPTEIEGGKIYWQTKENGFPLEIPVLLVLSMVLVVWGRNHDLQKKLKQRNLSLEEEYSNVVTKLALYLGAGMTIKSAWKKTAANQERWKPQGAVAKEMQLTCREMDSGVFESACYENFGHRCGSQEYIRLGTLLSQNLRKGNSELLNRLQAEVQLASEKQKHLVKRRGEEASTKLLVPMVLLLGITMVLIMVPAFSGIG